MKTARLARVLRGMEEANLKQVLITETESVYYLTGLWVRPGERLMALLIDETGESSLYINRMFTPPPTEGLKLAEFGDGDDSMAFLAQGLRCGTLGVDKNWPSHFLLSLMAHRRDIKMVVGSSVVDAARMYKDEEELDIMRRASRLNDQVVGSLPETLSTRDRESDVGRRFTKRATDAGARGFSFTPLVCFGSNCAEPHHNTDDTLLKKGDAVILDLGLDLDHMMSDMTRTVFFGGATDEQKRVYDIVKAANAAGRAAVRPGVLMSDIDRAARKVVEDAGYGPHFLHRTGHGIGLNVHESPDCSSVCHIVAQPGMTFSIEPGIYLPGKYGVRIEDLVAVTPDGCETLNALDRELRII